MIRWAMMESEFLPVLRRLPGSWLTMAVPMESVFLPVLRQPLESWLMIRWATMELEFLPAPRPLLDSWLTTVAYPMTVSASPRGPRPLLACLQEEMIVTMTIRARTAEAFLPGPVRTPANGQRRLSRPTAFSSTL